jgi:ABC-2 type transport system permease protein
MRPLRFLLKKEFKQIFRNRALLPMIFVMPLLQLLIMPLAADYEVKNINISIVDNDQSTLSKELTLKILASGYFRLSGYTHSYKESFKQIESDIADLILEIPHNFEKKLSRNGFEKLFIAVNAINGTKASLGGSYLNSIISEFSQNVRIKLSGNSPSVDIKSIDIASLNWFNPYMNYKIFMVPALLAIIVTMIGVYMCGLNIVKEKEIGTIEQINVSPIKKHHYILGKLIPFWIIGIIVFSIGFFIISWNVYGIIPLGNLFLLYAYLGLFLIALLGFGLLISAYSETQQQAMSVSFFFMMIFILMSGLFTSIDAMPSWAQKIAHINPVTYFIEVTRMVVLKGRGLVNITKHIYIMIGFAILFNTWAIVNYRKTT